MTEIKITQKEETIDVEDSSGFDVEVIDPSGFNQGDVEDIVYEWLTAGNAITLSEDGELAVDGGTIDGGNIDDDPLA